MQIFAKTSKHIAYVFEFSVIFCYSKNVVNCLINFIDKLNLNKGFMGVH